MQPEDLGAVKRALLRVAKTAVLTLPDINPSTSMARLRDREPMSLGIGGFHPAGLATGGTIQPVKPCT